MTGTSTDEDRADPMQTEPILSEPEKHWPFLT